MECAALTQPFRARKTRSVLRLRALSNVVLMSSNGGSSTACLSVLPCQFYDVFEFELLGANGFVGKQ